ncbi:MAG: beta-L-arabinofuranosidase domain-containing protein, partial [Candidatus Firestonebacteria bacterium]
CQRLFADITETKMYLTGGIGAVKKGEAFSFAYDLPNSTAYAETCAAIGLINFAHRMLKKDLDGKYSDYIERALYNGVLSGVSLDGRKFFYDNPLASSGKQHRKAWYDCSCCPPNIARLFASLGSYIYSVREKELVVHQYIAGVTTLKVSETEVRISQSTRYPWGNKIAISVDSAENISFTLKLRQPGWCGRMQVKVNGKPAKSNANKGYLSINRFWRKGDKISVIFNMPVKQLYADPRVRQDIGRTALQKGPVVYCFEEADNPAGAESLIIKQRNNFEVLHKKNLLGGVDIIKTNGFYLESVEKQKQLYGYSAPKLKECVLTAIPYFAWENRKPGSMAVWVKNTADNNLK